MLFDFVFSLGSLCDLGIPFHAQNECGPFLHLFTCENNGIVIYENWENDISPYADSP